MVRQRPAPGRQLRARVREVMEPFQGGPGATRVSLVVDLAVLICIVASCVLVAAEWLWPRWLHLFTAAEAVFTALFIVEYVARWYSAENRWRYPFTPLAVLDLLAILPSILMLGSEMLMLRLVRGVRLLRLLRLLRLVRLLRLIRYGPLIYRAVIRLRVWVSTGVDRYRLRDLGGLFVWALAALFVGANVLHVTERSLVGPGSPFSNYWQSYWNILIVLVSGIEDKEPVTVLGRLEVTVVMIAGLVIVGMLTGEIVSILVRRVQRAGKVALKPPTGRFEQHIVILGNNLHLDNVIRQVHAALAGRHFIVVVAEDGHQLEALDPAVYRKVFVVPGDPRRVEVLDRADIDCAARVIVLAPDVGTLDNREADNLSLMATVAVLSRGQRLPLVVQLRSSESLRLTRGLPEVDFVVTRSFGERMLAQGVLNPGVTEVYDHLLTFSSDSNEVYTIDVPERFVGRSFGDVQLELLDSEGSITPIGIDRSPDAAPNSCFWLCPEDPDSGLEPADCVLQANDRLIVLAYQRPENEDQAVDGCSPMALSRSKGAGSW